MHALGIKDPDVITRVTEYVPAILKMVEKIIERGHAYVMILVSSNLFLLVMPPKDLFTSMLLISMDLKDMLMEN